MLQKAYPIFVSLVLDLRIMMTATVTLKVEL